MKLTLQLVVVVLNAPTKFRDNLFKVKFILRQGMFRWQNLKKIGKVS